MYSASVAFIYVLTGITGNLARTKKLPALYRIISRLAREDRLGHIRIIGAGSRPKSPSQFRELVYCACKEHVRNFSESFFSQVFWPLLRYEKLDMSEQSSYVRFRRKINQARGSRQTPLVIDVSVLPQLYESFCQGFQSTMQSCGPINPQTLILFEKPLGHDRHSSARLLQLMSEVFGPGRAKVWEHFLGKEGFRKALEHRLSSGKIGGRWNSRHVKKLRLSITETKGLEQRIYFALTGICRDMVCNHAAAYLSALAMDAPRSYDPGDLQAALLEGARSFVPVDPACCMLGRYAANTQKGLPGYLEELNGLDLSDAERDQAFRLGTSFEGTLVSRAPQWRNSRSFRLPTGCEASGTEFSVEVRKCAPQTRKQVEVIFDPLRDEGAELPVERLVYHLEPGPARVKAFSNGKLLWSEQLGSKSPKEAYEQLLTDVLVDGHSAWFLDDKLVLACWDMFQPVLKAEMPQLIEYPACADSAEPDSRHLEALSLISGGVQTAAL